jgi:hypothetical protein
MLLLSGLIFLPTVKKFCLKKRCIKTTQSDKTDVVVLEILENNGYNKIATKPLMASPCKKRIVCDIDSSDDKYFEMI